MITMQAFLCGLRILLVFNFLGNFQQNGVNASDKFTLYQTKVANVTDFITFSNVSAQQCLGQCIRYPECQSVNVNIQEKLCMVNLNVNETFYKDFLVVEQNWMHYKRHTYKFTNMKEFQLTQNNKVDTIPLYSKGWILSFDIKPLGVQSNWCNIVQLSQFNIGEVSYTTPGNREPAVWFHPSSTRLVVDSTSMNGFSSYGDIKTIPLDIYTSVRIMQKHFHSFIYFYLFISFIYHFTVELDGTVEVNKTNTDARSYKHMNIYTSGGGAVLPANALIKNFRFESLEYTV